MSMDGRDWGLRTFCLEPPSPLQGYLLVPLTESFLQQLLLSTPLPSPVVSIDFGGLNFLGLLSSNVL